MEWRIGQLKHSFHVLHGEIRLIPPLKVCKVVEICALLHSICKGRNIQLPKDCEDEDVEVYDGGEGAAFMNAVSAVLGGQTPEGRHY